MTADTGRPPETEPVTPPGGNGSGEEAPPATAAPPAGLPARRGALAGAAVTLGAVAVGLLVGAGLIALAGGSPVAGYAAMLDAAFGGQLQLSRLLIGMTPLVLMGLGYAIAYRAKFITIGAQGQFDAGAIAAGALVLTVPLGTGWLAVPGAFAVAAVAGGALGAVVGWLRTRWGVNEIITSLMLNYLAFYLLAYVVRRPLSNPEGFTPESEVIADWARLPVIPGTRVHLGVLVALAAIPLVWWLVSRTRFGFAARVVGAGPDVARATGIDVSGTILRAAVLSGALGGLAGAIALTGSELRLSLGLSSGIGFTAIVVALLARLHPVAVAGSAALISALTLGGQALQRTQEIPYSVGVVVQAVMVLLVLLANRALDRRR